MDSQLLTAQRRKEVAIWIAVAALGLMTLIGRLCG